MTTVLTPWDRVKDGDKFMIGRTLYEKDFHRARAVDLSVSFHGPELAVIFPDGVPVLVEDKPKEAEEKGCVLKRNGPLYFLTDRQETAVLTWVERSTEPGKTYDLILVEREEGK